MKIILILGRRWEFVSLDNGAENKSLQKENPHIWFI